MKRQASTAPDQNSNGPAGSPSTGEPVFIAVGQLRRPHGIHGEMVMDILTDFPERLRANLLLYVGPQYEPVRIGSVRGHNKVLLVSIKGSETPEEAGRYRNMVMYVRRDQLPDLPEDQYYHHQLLGLSVVDESGQVLGKLVEIIETGANDVYVVKPEQGADILFPAVEGVVLEVDLEKSLMRVHPQTWG